MRGTVAKRLRNAARQASKDLEPSKLITPNKQKASIQLTKATAKGFKDRVLNFITGGNVRWDGYRALYKKLKREHYERH